MSMANERGTCDEWDVPLNEVKINESSVLLLGQQVTIPIGCSNVTLGPQLISQILICLTTLFV